MAGISSKAIGKVENKKKYNGIDFADDLGIDIYDAQLRELDAQIGRWWEIDPKVDGMEMWSPYTANYNNPIRFSDLLGDEGQECCKVFTDAIVQTAQDILTFGAGVANAFVTNQVAGVGRGDPNTFSNPRDAAIAQAGQTVGDLATIGAGAVSSIGGTVAAVGSVGLVSVPAGVLILQQVTVAIPTAIKNLSAARNNFEIADKDKLPNDALDPPSKKGNAPKSKEDGHPVEIHHDKQNKNGPFSEKTRTGHRGKENYKTNHPFPKKRSEIDRRSFDKEVRQYWTDQWNSGRFGI
jgi:RHS repeat-associated protein